MDDFDYEPTDHHRITYADFTPAARPAELTDELWARIEQCVTAGGCGTDIKGPAETLACMTGRGGDREPCSRVTPHPNLQSILYVLANRQA